MSEPRDPARWLEAGSSCDPTLRRVLDSARRGLPEGEQADALAAAIERAARGSTAIGGGLEQAERALRLRWWVSGVGIAGALVWLGTAMISSRPAPGLSTAKTSNSVAATGYASSDTRSADPSLAQAGPRTAHPGAGAKDSPAELEAQSAAAPPARRTDAASRAVSAGPSAAPTKRAERASRPRLRARDPEVRVGSGQVPAAASGSDSAPEQTDVPPELELLSAAQRALRVAPVEALALAEQHARVYAAGRFVEEREEIAIAALLALGDNERGAARARAFLERYPRSLAAARIERLLARAP